MNSTSAAQSQPLAPRLARALLAITFVATGAWKLATPVATLASSMPWMGEVSPRFLAATAALDLAVGVALLLPLIARRALGSTTLRTIGVAGALGGAALMLGAIVFHALRGEAHKTPFNVALMVLCAFVAWRAREGSAGLPSPSRSP